ncbi:lantibiotic protection ABC transporter permease subunit, MutG family [Clostridium sp. N3C]|uniref:lantibiotic immunity ABC transporter MutG family permease subunit n=1 Tax=Clostridium sp. N3C TaxID=1776758 RepID=UPI00092E17B6|nr:lantibiotic immunity ABC transporter MutG family permease subunit [Clostridium sp. N3C]SCN25026.1 lantibiotic protection ABC transporter permease subunit, MutG family [Clostridium sp. N3C]
MHTFIRCIRSDFYKFKHTSMLWIHILIPLITAILFITYYSESPWNVDAKISGYLEVIGVGFPLIIGLITAKTVDQEGEAGNFQNMLCGAKSPVALYVSKLIVLLLLGTLSIIIAIGIFALGFKAMPAIIYIKAGALLISGSVFVYILHLFVSLKYGRGSSIGLGIVESLISALALTGFGDGKWYYIPCTWSSRLCDSLVFTWLNPAMSFGYEEIQKCLIVAASATLAAFILSLFWFKRWEGRKSYD